MLTLVALGNGCALVPLDDQHVDAVPGQGASGGQTCRPGADDENGAGGEVGIGAVRRNSAGCPSSSTITRSSAQNPQKASGAAEACPRSPAIQQRIGPRQIVSRSHPVGPLDVEHRSQRAQRSQLSPVIDPRAAAFTLD